MEESKEMSFWDHLEELRWTLFRSIIALTVFAVIAFIFMPTLFDKVIMAPCSSDFFLYDFLCRITTSIPFLPDFCDSGFNVKIINIKLASQFMTHMSASFFMALILTFPYILYEIWKFVQPALYDYEKKNIGLVFLFGTVMFFLGCFVGYSVVFPMTLRFLATYQVSTFIENQLSLDSYMDNFLLLVFLMGVVFELPLVSWMLSRLGILTRSFFKRYRRHAVVVLMVAAAIITPSSDPFTLLVVFIPLYMLYELSAILVKSEE